MFLQILLFVIVAEFDDDRTLVVDLTLPHDLVEGSQRAWVTAVGDMMGPTLEVRTENMILLNIIGNNHFCKQGLSSLVRLPVGCGEQNMVLFTPNIFVMQYLESTNQLTKKIEEKTVGFMTKGKNAPTQKEFVVVVNILFPRLSAPVELQTQRRILFSFWSERSIGIVVADGVCRQVVRCRQALRSHRQQQSAKVGRMAPVKAVEKWLLPCCWHRSEQRYEGNY